LFLIIPALKLQNGCVVDSILSTASMQSFYQKMQNDPIEHSKLLRRENSKSLAIYDFDSFNNYNNTKNIETVFRIIQNIDIPIQLISNILTPEQIIYLLDNGVSRVFINEYIIDKFPDELQQLLEIYTPSRICLLIKHRDGFLVSDKNKDILQLCDNARKVGINRVLLIDLDVLDNKTNYDIDKLIQIANRTQMRITIYEGIRNSETLWSYKQLPIDGIDSVILGRSICENLFPCQKIWRLMESKLEK